MAGPDFSKPRAQVAKLMDDTVRITRDPKGASDATLDQVTGQLVGPGQPFVPTVIYQGPAIIRTARTSRYATQAGIQLSESDYFIAVPHDAGDFKTGDDVECLTSVRDPNLAGRHFSVKSVPFGTYLLLRRLIAELRQ